MTDRLPPDELYDRFYRAARELFEAQADREHRLSLFGTLLLVAATELVDAPGVLVVGVIERIKFQMLLTDADSARLEDFVEAVQDEVLAQKPQ